MIDLYVQVKYAQFLTHSLEGWKQTNTTLWNGRCVFCGDSSKSSNKKRGYIYKNPGGSLSYHCHNCGEHKSFTDVLKEISPFLYKQYRFEAFQNNKTEQPPEPVEEKIECRNWEKGIVKVSELSKIHPASKYLKQRMFPKEVLSVFYYTSDFQKWVHEVLGMTDKNVPADPRVLLVEVDSFNNLKLVVARSIDNTEERRYVTLHVDPTYPKIFGLSRLDFTKQIYGVEGAIDSLFLPNCFATLDANICSYKQSPLIRDPILVWDNEPRNKDVVRNMKRAIEYGNRVVIWPENQTEKDVNDLVKAEKLPLEIINRRTYRGLDALTRLSTWKRT